MSLVTASNGLLVSGSSTSLDVDIEHYRVSCGQLAVVVDLIPGDEHCNTTTSWHRQDSVSLFAPGGRHRAIALRGIALSESQTYMVSDGDLSIPLPRVLHVT